MTEHSGHDLMRHALGVQAYVCHKSKGGRRWKKPYRNHFVAGDHDAPIWDALVTDGLARKTSNGNPITGGMPAYVVTDAGREAALAGIIFKRRWGYGNPTNA